MSSIKLTADSGGGTVELKAPATTTSNAALQFKLPVADGSSGQALTTNASGQLAFATVAGGKVLQVLYTESTTYVSTTATRTQLLTLAITPASSSNKVYVIGMVHAGAQKNSNSYTTASIFRGTTYSEDLADTELARGFAGANPGSNKEFASYTLVALDSPNTSSAQTYALTFGKGSVNTTSVETDARYSLTLIEIAA